MMRKERRWAKEHNANETEKKKIEGSGDYKEGSGEVSSRGMVLR